MEALVFQTFVSVYTVGSYSSLQQHTTIARRGLATGPRASDASPRLARRVDALRQLTSTTRVNTSKLTVQGTGAHLQLELLFELQLSVTKQDQPKEAHARLSLL